MGSDDLTIEILKSIRDEARLTNERLEQTNERIEQTNERIDQTNLQLVQLGENLSRRIVESEMRTATAITDLAGTVRDLVTVLRSNNDLRPRLERCEQDIAVLKQRLPDA